jgi:heat shock protein HslJ
MTDPAAGVTMRQKSSLAWYLQGCLLLLVGCTSALRPGSAAPAVPLENVEWQLVALADKPVSTGASQRAPGFTLRSADHRVQGFGGCNNLLGGYRLQGEGIAFQQMAMTMMACDSAMDTESALRAVLDNTVKWRIRESTLELLDATGHTLARFQSQAH